MTIPCANCGTSIADDEYRCPTCDALAPVPEPDGPDGEAAILPWAIPIRERRRPPVRSRDPLRPAAYGVLALALLAGLVAIGAQVLGGGDAGTESGRDSEVAGDVVDADPGVDAQADEPSSEDSDTTSDGDGPTASAPTTASSTAPAAATPTTTSTTSPTTAAPRSTTTPPAVAASTRPGSVPMLSSSFSGGWIAQLTSVPASAGPDAIEAAWSQARSDAPGAVVTRSDDWSSLQPGYWVVVSSGPFADVDDVRTYCASIPQGARTECLARQLTGRR